MRGDRQRVILLAVFALLMWVFIRSIAAARFQEVRQSDPGPSQSMASFVGVGGCAAMACHGGTRANERREYTIWIEHDRHSRAFLLLYEPRALQMARQLGIERPD